MPVRKANEELLWYQKYRPDSLDTYVGNEELKSYMAECIESNSLENLIFHGKPGGGKTTAAKIIYSSLKCDSLYLNGSDENGIDTVRDRIKTFATTASFKSLKIVVLDDCHNLTPAAQQALLNLIETTSKSTRFIFTTNSIGRIIPALQSRCHAFAVAPPDKGEVAEFLDGILEKEGITYEMNDLVALVNKRFPDIRQTINELQICSKTGVYVPGTSTDNAGYMDDIINILLEDRAMEKRGWARIRQIVADNALSDFTDLYRYLYEKVSEIVPASPGEACLIIADAECQSAFVPDREITFMACIHRLLQLK